MKILYLDCFAGASGDMLLGALLDVGLSPVDLQIELKKLHLPEKWHLHVHREKRLGLEGVKLTFHASAHCDHHPGSHSHPHDHPHHPGAPSPSPAPEIHHHASARDYGQIVDLLKTSDLAESIVQKSIAVFHRIAVAEGKIHGQAPEEVHFHEVGAVDSLLDIVGFCAGVEKLKIEAVYASTLVEGTGWMECAHGRFPIPAPATLEILAGQKLRQENEPHELITPTGAALLAEFVQGFGLMPELTIQKIGYGLGTRHLSSRPNAIRAVVGELHSNLPAIHDVVSILETNLDDMSGEMLGAIQEQLWIAGALDVSIQSLQMKKNRPGFLLSVICAPTQASALTEIVLTQTTAFGLRQIQAIRTVLQREIKTVATPWGSVSVKLGYWQNRLVQIAPEFDSCQALAHHSGQSLSAIYAAARQAIGMAQ